MGESKLPLHTAKPSLPYFPVFKAKLPLIGHNVLLHHLNLCRRRHNEHSTYALKRQRVEPLLQLSPAAPLGGVANPPPAAEETLRSGIVGFDHFNPNPLHHPNTEVLTVPDISLSIQNYITDKVDACDFCRCFLIDKLVFWFFFCKR